MRLTENIIKNVQSQSPAKKKRRARRPRVRKYDRRAMFVERIGNIGEWNVHDFITYYERLYCSVFGYTPVITMGIAAGKVKYFLSNWRSNEEAKIAMQLYFTRLTSAPPTIGFMTTAWTINELREHWDEPFSSRVLDKRVFAS